jgi:ribosomal protein S2
MSATARRAAVGHQLPATNSRTGRFMFSVRAGISAFDIGMLFAAADARASIEYGLAA